MAHVDSQPARRGPSLTQQIFIGLALGIIAGWLVSEYNPAAAVYFRPFSQLFLRMIKMIIAPLIFATLVVGIAGHGDDRSGSAEWGCRRSSTSRSSPPWHCSSDWPPSTSPSPASASICRRSRRVSSTPRRPRSRPGRSSSTSCRVRLRGGRQDDVLQIVFWSILFGVALGDRRARPASRHVVRPSQIDVQVHRTGHEVRPHRHRRGDRRDRRA